MQTYPDLLGTISDKLRADPEVVLIAVSHAWNLVYAAKGGFEYGGLKLIEYMVNLAYARRAVKMIIFASIVYKDKDTSLVTTCNILSKLNGHGQHYGVNIRRRIASYVGIPNGINWHLSDLPNTTDGPLWSILNLAIKEKKNRKDGDKFLFN